MVIGYRFSTPAVEQSSCCKLVVDRKVISDPEVQLEESGVQHFSSLAKSWTETMPGLEELHFRVDQLPLECSGPSCLKMFDSRLY